MKEFIRPVATPTEALTTNNVGRPFKPEGRAVVPQDCVEYHELSKSIVYVIDKLFCDEDTLVAGPNDPGVVAENSYYAYTNLLQDSSEEAKQARETAASKFKEIAGFEIDEVIKFENQIRELRGLELI